jgi:hypothetical protein
MGRYNWRTRKYEHSNPDDIEKIDDAIKNLREQRQISNERVAMGQEDKGERNYRPRAPGKQQARLRGASEDEELAVGLMKNVIPREKRKENDFETPANKQPKTSAPDQSVSNLPSKAQAEGTMAKRQLFEDDVEMEEEPMSLASRSVGTQTSNSQNQMQKVRVIPRQPEMGPITEQRTVCLPLTFYLSLNQLNQKSAVCLRIRMNNHYDILKNTTLTAQVVNTGRNKGVSNDYAFELPYNTDTTTSLNGPELIPFPTTVKGTVGSSATTSSSGTHDTAELRPAWRRYYDRVWSAYANYKTEYKISILNAANHTKDLSKVQLLTKQEQYTQSTGASRLIPSDAPLAEALTWGLTKHNIDPRNVNSETSDFTVIEGVWTPMKAEQLNVFNDEDKKVWFPSDNENPLMTEDLTILAYKHDMYPVAPRVIRTHETQETYNHSNSEQSAYTKQWMDKGTSNINLKIDLKYYVVYKDLKREWRYPRYTDNDAAALNVHDQYQKPRVPEYVPNSSPNNAL